MLAAVATSGRPMVLTIAIPPGIFGCSDFEGELNVLRAANDDPYPELIAFDCERRRLLVERLGNAVSQLGWSPQHLRHRTGCDSALTLVHVGQEHFRRTARAPRR
ncbi:MAG: hypothetical protein ACYCVN_14585 [Acidimicrobiales bacterium]